MKHRKTAVLLSTLIGLGLSPAIGQDRSPSTADAVRSQFADINRKVLEMAKDFPEDKYGYQLKPEMRSFGAVLVHIASGNAYAAKAGRGEKVKWDELDPKNYATKTAVVALLEKSIADAGATMKNLSGESFTRSVEPWLSVIEHSAEHYGLLVAYFRTNGLTPPESRPRK